MAAPTAVSSVHRRRGSPSLSHVGDARPVTSRAAPPAWRVLRVVATRATIVRTFCSGVSFPFLSKMVPFFSSVRDRVGPVGPRGTASPAVIIYSIQLSVPVPRCGERVERAPASTHTADCVNRHTLQSIARVSVHLINALFQLPPVKQIVQYPPFPLANGPLFARLSVRGTPALDAYRSTPLTAGRDRAASSQKHVRIRHEPIVNRESTLAGLGVSRARDARKIKQETESQSGRSLASRHKDTRAQRGERERGDRGPL